MKQFLEDEQKSRKELERVVRKLAKQKNDCAWDDGSHWMHPYNHPHPVHGYICVLVEEHEGSGVCICEICLMLRLHISITHSRVGDDRAWSFLASAAGARCDIVIKPNLSSRSSLTRWDYKYASSWSSSAKLRLIQGDVSQNILPLGDWHCEHSPANGTISDGDKTISLLLLSLPLDLEKEYEAIKSNKWSPACTSVTKGTDFLPLISLLILFLPLSYFYLLQGTPEGKWIHWAFMSMCILVTP